MMPTRGGGRARPALQRRRSQSQRWFWKPRARTAAGRARHAARPSQSWPRPPRPGTHGAPGRQRRSPPRRPAVPLLRWRI
jgi:hypothetical protein